jgi:hypothetical protein
VEYKIYSGKGVGTTGECRKTTQVKPDQKNGTPPEKKGAGAEQYASQEETSILQHSFPIKQQQHTV